MANKILHLSNTLTRFSSVADSGCKWSFLWNRNYFLSLFLDTQLLMFSFISSIFHLGHFPMVLVSFHFRLSPSRLNMSPTYLRKREYIVWDALWAYFISLKTKSLVLKAIQETRIIFLHISSSSIFLLFCAFSVPDSATYNNTGNTNVFIILFS